jgi:hypothetical protein
MVFTRLPLTLLPGSINPEPIRRVIQLLVPTRSS